MIMNGTRTQERVRLPQELIDIILDYLHEDRSLAYCSLVCRAWLPRSRHHLFHTLSDGFNSKPQLDQFLDIIPHIGGYVRFLTLGFRSVDLATLLALFAQLPNLHNWVLRWDHIDDNHTCTQSHCSQTRRIRGLRLCPNSLTDNLYVEFLAILHIFAEINTLSLDLAVRSELSDSGSLRGHLVLLDTTRPIVVRKFLLSAPSLDMPEASHPYQFFQRCFATDSLRCFALQATRRSAVVACSIFIRNVGRSLETLALDVMLADWEIQPEITAAIQERRLYISSCVNLQSLSLYFEYPIDVLLASDTHEAALDVLSETTLAIRQVTFDMRELPPEVEEGLLMGSLLNWARLEGILSRLSALRAFIFVIRGDGSDKFARKLEQFVEKALPISHSRGIFEFTWDPEPDFLLSPQGIEDITKK